jgi:hypothetical protein
MQEMGKLAVPVWDVGIMKQITNSKCMIEWIKFLTHCRFIPNYKSGLSSTWTSLDPVFSLLNLGAVEKDLNLGTIFHKRSKPRTKHLLMHEFLKLSCIYFINA